MCSNLGNRGGCWALQLGDRRPRPPPPDWCPRRLRWPRQGRRLGRRTPAPETSSGSSTRHSSGRSRGAASGSEGDFQYVRAQAAPHIARLLAGRRRDMFLPVASDPSRTIVFLDLTRFTALTDAHGDDAAAEVVDRFVDAVTAAVVGRGRLVKTLGDGVLLEARDAAAAIEVADDVSHRLHDAEAMPEVTGGIATGSVVDRVDDRSEEHTSELQSLMRISYAVFCLKKKKKL